MKYLFVPYQLAILAKEKGFKEPCFGIFFSDLENGWQFGFSPHHPNATGTCMSPLYQQLVDWFREKHKVDCRVFPMFESEESYKTVWGWNVMELEWGEDKEHHLFASCSTSDRNLSYYEALNASIQKAFELI